VSGFTTHEYVSLKLSYFFSDSNLMEVDSLKKFGNIWVSIE